MSVKIGHASIDENGKAQGGSAGDQTGTEVCTRDWYAKGWNKLIRANDSAVAEKIAAAMEAACANNKIGYDQGQRTTLFTEAKAKNWNIAGITTACECDCSSLVAVCVNAAGVTVSKDIYTGNEAVALKNTGKFTVYTEAKYLTGDSHLKRGYILLKEGSHTAVVLSNGSNVTIGGSGSTAADSLKYVVGDIVEFTGTTHYTSSYSGGIAKNCKAGKAKITQTSTGQPHPYHLQAVSGSGSTVSGWVNSADIKGATTAGSGTITAGKTVKVKSSATKYATGQTIPSWVKNQKYTVQQINGDRALLKEITSWVSLTDLELA